MTDNRKDEIWKDVAGYEGTYQVSDAGRVRSKRGILKGSKGSTGYLRIGLFDGEKYKYKSVHSLVMESFTGKRPPAAHINHIDGNKANNSPSNLEYCSAAYNNIHARKNKLIDNCGEKSANAKFTNKDAVKIRSLYPTFDMTQIAKMYGVSKRSILNVVRGFTFKEAINNLNTGDI